MDWVKPVVTFSILDRSVILWVMRQNGMKYWGVTDEFKKRVTACMDYDSASHIFDKCVEGLKKWFGRDSAN